MSEAEARLNSNMKALPLHDLRYLEAADGWLGLGDYAAPNDELEWR